MSGSDSSQDSTEEAAAEDEPVDRHRQHLLDSINRRSFLKTAAASSLAAGIPLNADTATAQQSGTGSLSIDWQQTYGNGQDDAANSVIQTDDGGYAFAGWKTPSGSGNREFWLAKTDTDGGVDFEKVVGGSDNDSAEAVIQTADGGYAVCGQVKPDGATVLKTDADGNIEFNRSYPPHGHMDDIVQTDDGGYGVDTGIVIGFGNESFLKLDAAGDVVVENDNYIGDRIGRPQSLVQTDDGGFALAGYMGRDTDSDALFVKLDADGQLDFYTEYTTSGSAQAWSIVQTDDGGYAMVGSEGHQGDVESKSWFRKVDADANVEFKRTYEDSSGQEQARSVVQTDDGGYAFVGFAGDGSDRDAWFRKLDVDGNVEVMKVFAGDEGDEARSLAQTADGGFVIGGLTRSSGAGGSDAWLIKTEPIQQQQVSLQLDNVRPVQVVFDTGLGDDDRLDLVEDKEAAVLVYPGGQNLPNLSGDVTFRLLAEEDDAFSSTDEVTVSAEEYQTAAENDEFFELFATPSGTGDKEVRVQIEATDDDAQIPATDNTISAPITTRETRKMHLAFYRVRGELALYSTPDRIEYIDMIANSNDFVTATFPVAKQDYRGEVKFDVLGESEPVIGLFRDLMNLDFFTWVTTDQGRGVGVVSSGYFGYHLLGSGTTGVTAPKSSLNSVLVEVNKPTVTAHEIGHQFGLHVDTEEYHNDFSDIDGDGEDEYIGNNEDTAEGYWVERQRYISERTAFMEATPAVDGSLYRWIDNDNSDYPVDYRDYDVIFEQMQDDSSIATAEVNADSNDDILYLKGLIHKDGSVDLSPWYFFGSGSLTAVEEGDYAAVVRDGSGSAVSRQSFQLGFQLNAAAAEASVDSPFSTDVDAFSFPIRYPPEARSVEITEDGETLVEVEPNSKLLHDAIDSIPDDGFDRTPEQRRTALHNKVDAIQQMLEQDDVRGAVQKLRNDLRPSLDRWLVDDYETSTPAQLSKEDVLGLVDNLASRLEGLTGNGGSGSGNR